MTTLSDQPSVYRLLQAIKLIAQKRPDVFSDIAVQVIHELVLNVDQADLYNQSIKTLSTADAERILNSELLPPWNIND